MGQTLKCRICDYIIMVFRAAWVRNGTVLDNVC